MVPHRSLAPYLSLSAAPHTKDKSDPCGEGGREGECYGGGVGRIAWGKENKPHPPQKEPLSDVKLRTT